MDSTKTISKFGTAPVFFTAISTILGAVMFLRFGFAVGNVGFFGTILIVLIGHAVTIPTAMAIAEIATNQKVEGGGEYYIISRSFGLVIGTSIGLALYLSQAISVAFYIIAFAEAFNTLFTYILNNYELSAWAVYLLEKKQTVSIPALFLLTTIVLVKGADLGVKALYGVVVILFISLIAFFVGQTDYSSTHVFEPFAHVGNTISETKAIDTISTTSEALLGDTTLTSAAPTPINTPNNSSEPSRIPLSFFAVFAIIFPAFTGMTAGVGLSGDLKNPSRSIPLGTLAGTITGMLIYFLIAYKLSISASPEAFAATVSSALGSLMVAPRTLQAIAKDRILPSSGINTWLSAGKGNNDEPFNATVATIAIAFVFVVIGELDFVAEIISMFFMVTYGSLCLISFLQHFAADPSYRPTFKSRWYISLFGAVACFGLMFFMNAGYALLAISLMVLFYVIVNHFNPNKNNIAVIFQGAIFQISRRLQIFLQKAEKEKTASWRPSVVCISERSFDRFAAFDLLRWISQKYGFGTYIHKISGYLSKTTNQEAKESKARLIKMAEASNSNVYIDTLISPSYTSAIAQVIQLPGISGTENNLLMFEYSKVRPDNLANIVDNFKLIKSVDFDVVVLGSTERGFGFKREIHIWITPNDYENATLMILLGYIILGHQEWSEGFIKIFAIYPEETIADEKKKLMELIEAGQLPISPNNIEVLTRKTALDVRAVISDKSKDADMTIIGFRGEMIKHEEMAVFQGYDDIGNVVFVNAAQKKIIK